LRRGFSFEARRYARPVADEEKLLALLRAGDEDAFGELVDRYHPRLLRLAQSIVTRRELAEEVVQETWIAVIRGVEEFEGRSSLRTWIYRICVNRARTAAGKEYRSALFDSQEPDVDSTWFAAGGAWASPVEPWPDAVDARVDAMALMPKVRAALEHLPFAQRLVVTLRDVEGLSSAEVCDVLSINEVNQRVLLHRGRNRLRSALDSDLKGGERAATE
jgi:RNA polymerase sigma-70 factor, ECF subfamily